MKRKLALMLAVATLSMGVFVGCSAPAEDTTVEDNTVSYTDGTYEGVGNGFKGDIKVSVEVADGKITNIEVLEQDETPGMGDVAIEEVAQNIIDAQSTEVEIVSGATGSSNGTIEAVENALEGK